MELNQKTQTAVATAVVIMLKCSWIESEYGLDILRTTKGSHLKVY